MDEFEAVNLLIAAQQDFDGSSEPNILSAIILFHQNRHYLLECWRLLFRYVTDEDSGGGERDILLDIISEVLETKNGPSRNASLYARKCCAAMDEIESWVYQLTERAQGAIALGQPLTPWYDEALRFQQTSLQQQHESLGTIVTLLVKANYTIVEDFHKLLDRLPRIERWSQLTVHYIPIVVAFVTQFGSSEGSATLREARSLNTKIIDSSGAASWMLGHLHAVTVVFWLVEYGSWYIDAPSGSPLQGVNLETEAHARAEAFSKALTDGAFQCILSICSSLRPSQWYNPTRSGLIDFLLRDAPSHGLETISASSYFQELFMEQLEAFTNSFITNMPDTLRKFKVEEDEQRRWLRSGQQSKGYSRTAEQALHLERFMVIVSFTYQDRPESAIAFWEDPDGNLYGFLHWASKRLSTPQVAAFCLMLSSIAEGNECASSAHRFLKEESKAALSRPHKSSSLNWSLIFEELSVYTSKVRDRSLNTGASNPATSASIVAEISEPESVLMLECYLRLAAKICRESGEAARWILSHPSFKMVDNLLLLCSNGVPGRIQSCAFGLLHGLTMAADSDMIMALWSSVDHWISGAFGSAMAVPRAANKPSRASHIEEVTLDAIAGEPEVASEFTALLRSLMTPWDENMSLHDKLPFSEQLGASYRMPGIDPYIDLVFGKIISLTVPQSDDILHRRILLYNILDFGATCLETFNENLIILANQSSIDVDFLMSTSSLQTYVTLHPFCRVMDWMFNENVLKELFAASHQDIHELASAAPDSPLVLLVCRCLDLMNLMMDLQSTYLEVLRPILSTKLGGQRVSVFSSLVTSFQDAVAGNLGLIVDLAKYSSVGIQSLAISSLSLLGKLASSRRLNNWTSSFNRSQQNNRLIEILHQHNELESIQQHLTSAMIITDRELDQGPQSSRWMVKQSILDFLIRCLGGMPSRPSLAHALLGFTCHANDLFVEGEGPFARGSALFHAVVKVVMMVPDGEEAEMLGWMLSLKRRALQVLRALWQSPITSSITLAELQNFNFLSELFIRQVFIDIGTRWDGRTLQDEDFIFTESTTAFEDYLYQRDTLLDLISKEIRLSQVDESTKPAYELLPTLLDFKPALSEGIGTRLSTLDLLDFIDLEPCPSISLPTFTFFAGIGVEALTMLEGKISTGGLTAKILEDLISLQFNQLHLSGRLASPVDVENAETEASLIFLARRGQLNTKKINDLRLGVLKAWSSSLVLILSIPDCEEADRLLLTSRTLEIMTPKLEQYAMDVRPEAIEIAKILQFLLCEHALPTASSSSNSSSNSSSDGMAAKIFQLFQTTVHAIHVPDGSVELREILYGICRTYLSSSLIIDGKGDLWKEILQTVKLAGPKLVETMCDDALGELGSCRVSALMTLRCFQDIAHAVNSDYVTTALSRANFIVVLVEAIQDLPLELRETASQGTFTAQSRMERSWGTHRTDRGADVPALLACYESQLSLLMSMAQARIGATYVSDAGLFQSIHASRLFSVDPDLGIGAFTSMLRGWLYSLTKLSKAMENADALVKFYILLLALARLVISVVISRGPQNQQSIVQARTFLAENRSLVVAMFKRSAKIGQVTTTTIGDATETIVEELVGLFVLLITFTNFTEYEEKLDTQGSRKTGFT